MARKPVKSHEEPSEQMKEWMKKKEAEERKGRQEAGGAAPKPGSTSAPPPARSASGPPAASPRMGTTRPTRHVQEARPDNSGLRSVLIGVLVVALGVGIVTPIWLTYKKANAKPTIGASQIGQLREGMTPDQVAAVLGKAEVKRPGPGKPRENAVDKIESAKYYEYFRKGTLMCVYTQDKKLIEVCIGETSQEYYDRKAGKEKALWEGFPETGFVHQDVWRPNQQTSLPTA